VIVKVLVEVEVDPATAPTFRTVYDAQSFARECVQTGVREQTNVRLGDLQVISVELAS
jgi:hypothetical protein